MPLSEATQRALMRVVAGESIHAAARAEGMSYSAVYSAARGQPIHDAKRAARYRATRERVGTQADVAQRLGVRLETLSRRENARTAITVEMELALRYLEATR